MSVEMTLRPGRARSTEVARTLQAFAVLVAQSIFCGIYLKNETQHHIRPVYTYKRQCGKRLEPYIPTV